MGLAKLDSKLNEYGSQQTLPNSDTPLFINENIKAFSAATILSDMRTKQNKSKNKQVKNLLRHLPEDIVAFKLICPECSREFKPDWLKLRSTQLIPVKPDDHDGPARWIPKKTSVICPSCEEVVPLDLPVVKMQSKVMLFGDEAYREEQGKLIFTYSLVGADFKAISKVEESLRKLKLELCPSESPDSWFFHMKELWPPDNRKKHRIFSSWSFEKVRLAVEHLFQLIQSHAQYLFIYNVAAFLWFLN